MSTSPLAPLADPCVGGAGAEAAKRSSRSVFVEFPLDFGVEECNREEGLSCVISSVSPVGCRSSTCLRARIASSLFVCAAPVVANFPVSNADLNKTESLPLGARKWPFPGAPLLRRPAR